MTHEVGTVGSGESAKGVCACGWMGPSRTSHEAALEDARQHRAQYPLSPEEGQRLLLLREAVRVRRRNPTWDDVAFALCLFDRVKGRRADAD